MRSPHSSGAQASSTPRAMGDQPAAGDGLGQAGALFPAGRGGKVAQPGKALQLRAPAARARPELAEIRCRRARTSSDPKQQPAAKQRIAPGPIAEHMVARHRDQPKRLPALTEQARKERAFGEPAQLIVAHAAFGHSGPKSGDIGGILVGPAAECRGARDQHGGAGIDRLRRGGGIDPAVDFDIDDQILLGDAGWRSPRSSSAGRR